MRHPLIAGLTLFAFITLTLGAGPALADGAQDPGAAEAAEEAPPANAPPPTDAKLELAKRHFETGRAAYDAHDYPRAIREFKAAASIRPSPILDYNLGLAYEGVGKPRVAAKLYQRYLERSPNAPNRADVEQRIATLLAAPADGAQQQPEPAPGTVVVEGGPPPSGGPPPVGGPQPVYRTQPKKRSYWWIVFPIAGGATLITLGAIVVIVAAADAAAAVNYPLGTAGPEMATPTHYGIRF